MKVLQNRIPTTFLLLTSCMTTVKGAYSAPATFLPSQYPSHPNDPTCQSAASGARICDPHSILTTTSISSLSDSLMDMEQRKILLPVDCFRGDESTSNKLPVQYGVAVLRKMDLLTSMNENEDSLDLFADEPEKAAEVFARHIHDTWGVGMEASPACGGTGVLLFLAIDDRSVYISKGGAMERILTNRRLDKINDGMRPFLQKKQYEAAISYCINSLDQYLADGPPTWTEMWKDASMGIMIVLSVVSVVGFMVHQQNKEDREYQRVASQLSEIDRSRALALQGKFQARSCPICLEDFKPCAEKMTKNDGGSVVTEEMTTVEFQGSDGLPLKLLRCGHVFDETCWKEWANSGSGKGSRCPICKQSVDGSEAATDDANNSRLHEEQEDLHHRGGRNTVRRNTLNHFNAERDFRLLRLSQRYPRYVQQEQLERWTRPGYNGAMARDQRFAQNNPQVRRMEHASRASSSSGGFGGGRSSGGRGSRW